MHLVEALIRILAGFALLVLPGAWIACTCLRGAPAIRRLAAAAALSPPTLAVALYVLRFLGLDFGSALVALVVLSATGLVPLLRSLRHSGAGAAFDLRTAVVLGLPVLLLAPVLASLQTRAYAGHAWLYADVAYQIADEALRPEESTLVGVPLSYPWLGSVPQALLGAALDTPPVASWIWFSLLGMTLVGGYVVAMSDLGRRRGSATLATLPALFFGINLLGALLLEIFPQDPGTYWTEGMWADGRFTPWLAKFYFMQLEPLALPLFAAFLFEITAGPPAGERLRHSSLVVALASGLGLIFPPLFPPAAITLAASVFSTVRRGEGTATRDRIVALFVSTAATATYVAAVTTDRVSPSVLLDLANLPAKLMSLVLVTLPLILLSLVGLRGADGALAAAPSASRLLVATAAGTAVLYLLFHLPGWRNEYKLLLAIGVALAPFAAPATERLLAANPRTGLLCLVAAALVLPLPLAASLSRGFPLDAPPGPQIDASEFSLALIADTSESRMARAIRDRTPASTFIVARSMTVHLPTLARRSLFIAAPHTAPPGVGMAGRELLLVARGYDPAVLEKRWRALEALYGAADDLRVGAMAELRQVGRPFAVILSPQLDIALAGALRSSQADARLLASAPGLEAWLVDASSAP